MKNLRGGTHTTLTETAELVAGILERVPGVTKISPGIISKSRAKGGSRYITATFTTAGLELLISGQGVQKVAVHCDVAVASEIYTALTTHKSLSLFTFKTRDRKPGI
jgi:hypothetical protein